jgi:hypothetical protein
LKNLVPAAALAAALCFGAVAAHAVTYECKITNAQARGWIPEMVFIEHDVAKKQAMVVDPIIQYFVGQPVVAKIDTDNAKRTTFVWTLKNTKDSGGQYANMIYRLTYLKGTGKLNMTGDAPGYVGPYTGQGSCKVIN